MKRLIEILVMLAVFLPTLTAFSYWSAYTWAG